MTETTPTAQSAPRFVWYELMTTDHPAAEAFYREVIGWGTQDAGMPGWAYTLLSAGPTQVAGMMALPPEAREAGARPAWVGYVGVGDVDAYAERVVQLGGAIHRPAADIPGVGRFAVVADPQGATFVLFKSQTAPASEQPAPGTPGHTGWHELYASHLDSAYAFYAALFDWTQSGTMDMGDMGTYLMFATGGTEAVGGMMTRPPFIPTPFWLYYINVDDINAAVARVTAHGGQVLVGPMEVPGGHWTAQCTDPQGGTFAMVATR